MTRRTASSNEGFFGMVLDQDIEATNVVRVGAMTSTPELVVVRSEPLCAESSLELQEDGLTPISAFYIRNNFPIPTPATRFTVGGAVNRPLSLAAEDFRRLPRRQLTATLECAGNGRAFMNPPVPGEPWRLGAVSTAAWEGVPLSVVLGQAEAGTDAVEVIFRGADGFVRSLPIEDALGPDVLIVDTMNDEPLTAAHGAPFRLLVAGWYGMAAVKWLAGIEVSRSPFRGHFQVERYVIGDRPLRTMHVRSLILEPADGATVPPAPQVVRGVAWTGSGHVTLVEFSDDGGATWYGATLLATPKPYTWCQWEASWSPARPGPATLLARASDSSGAQQPLQPVWNTLGYANNASVPRQVHVSGRSTALR
jgi:DMSO/TMAO reductase YedYZ molybdopterin-dependent catalytic subunit